jgi:hypothetical protein
MLGKVSMTLVLISTSRARATSAAPGCVSSFDQEEGPVVEPANIAVTDSGRPRHYSVKHTKMGDLATTILLPSRSTKRICLHQRRITIHWSYRSDAGASPQRL